MPFLGFWCRSAHNPFPLVMLGDWRSFWRHYNGSRTSYSGAQCRQLIPQVRNSFAGHPQAAMRLHVSHLTAILSVSLSSAIECRTCADSHFIAYMQCFRSLRHHWFPRYQTCQSWFSARTLLIVYLLQICHLQLSQGRVNSKNSTRTGKTFSL